MTTIYFTYHQTQQLVEFLKKYPCIIYVEKHLEYEFQRFARK